MDFGFVEDFVKKEKDEMESQLFKVKKELDVLKFVYEDMVIGKVKVEEYFFVVMREFIEF